MSQIAVFSAPSRSLFDIGDLFFWTHGHRECRRQTNAQSLSILLPCRERRKGKVAPYFPQSLRPVAFSSRALKYVQFLFSEAVSRWLKSRSKPCGFPPRAFFLLLGGSSAVWRPRCELTDRLLRGAWHRPGLAARESVVANLSYARARELTRFLLKTIVFLQECWGVSVVAQQRLLKEENSFLGSQQTSCFWQWTAASVEGMAWRRGDHRGDLLRCGVRSFLMFYSKQLAVSPGKNRTSFIW